MYPLHPATGRRVAPTPRNEGRNPGPDCLTTETGREYDAGMGQDRKGEGMTAQDMTAARGAHLMRQGAGIVTWTVDRNRNRVEPGSPVGLGWADRGMDANIAYRWAEVRDR